MKAQGALEAAKINITKKRCPPKYTPKKGWPQKRKTGSWQKFILEVEAYILLQIRSESKSEGIVAYVGFLRFSPQREKTVRKKWINCIKGGHAQKK